MNIQNILNINFLSLGENQNQTRKYYIAPQKPDTFERSTSQKLVTKKGTIVDKLSKVYDKKATTKLDEKSNKIIKEDNLNTDKILSLTKDMTTSKTQSITLKRADYDGKNNYILHAIDDGNIQRLKLLDKDLKVVEQEKIKIDYNKNGKPTNKTVLTQDFRTNTFNETKFAFDNNDYPVMTSAIKIKHDGQNRLIRKEIYEKSDVDGIYNIKYEFPNGKSRQLSKATKDKNTGAVIIEKDMRSADMTRTQYRYEDDPNGNRIIDYKITSPSGNILMNQSQTFEVLDKNKFRSTRNDKTYLMEFDNKTKIIKVIDEKTNNANEIDLKTMISGRKTPLINMLKTISGDELINLKNSVLGMVEAKNGLDSYCQNEVIEESNYFFDEDQSYMYSILNVSDDPFIFLHELGHATDVGGKLMKEIVNKDTNKIELAVKDSLRDDKLFKDIYNEERQNFLKEFPTNEREHISYFIADEATPGRPEQGRKETIAETNAILNTYQSTSLLGMRTQYLQQHFPKTIAYLSEKLAPTK